MNPEESLRYAQGTMYYRFFTLFALTLLPGMVNATDAPERNLQTIYLDVLGKGGIWGLGYDALFSDQFAAGATGSFYILDGKQVMSLSPYLTYYPFIAGPNRWLLQAGPQFLREATVSPVEEWSGTRSIQLGAELSGGYEYRDQWLFRTYGMISAGGNGVLPWLGVSVGRTL